MYFQFNNNWKKQSKCLFGLLQKNLKTNFTYKKAIEGALLSTKVKLRSWLKQFMNSNSNSLCVRLYIMDYRLMASQAYRNIGPTSFWLT